VTGVQTCALPILFLLLYDQLFLPERKVVSLPFYGHRRSLPAAFSPVLFWVGSADYQV